MHFEDKASSSCLQSCTSEPYRASSKTPVMEEHLNAVRLWRFGSTEKVTHVLMAEIPYMGNHAQQNTATNAQNLSVSPHNAPVLARSGTAELWLNCKLGRQSGIAGLLIDILPPKNRAVLGDNKNPKPNKQKRGMKQKPTNIRCVHLSGLRCLRSC